MPGVRTSLVESTGQDVPIPQDGSWVTSSLSIDGLLAASTVESVDLKFTVYGGAPEGLQAKLAVGEVEQPLTLAPCAGDPISCTWTYQGAGPFAGLPVTGTWSLVVRQQSSPVASSRGAGHIDGMTLRIYYRGEMPALYQVTESLPGRLAARRCSVCDQLGGQMAGAFDPKLRIPATTRQSLLSGWQAPLVEGFEVPLSWPAGCWLLTDGSDDGFERTWAPDDYRAHGGEWAAWPARGGADGLDPSMPVGYPAGLDSWMICGPFDWSQASNASAGFWLWSQLEEVYDEFFFGVADRLDGPFYGWSWDTPGSSWAHHQFYFPSFAGRPAADSVWLAWNFRSDYENPVRQEGPWVDDIEVAHSLPCSLTDPGPKGLNVHPNELPAQAPTIEEGDSSWVRLEFRMGDGGLPDLQRYGEVVDDLCAHGIGVVGLVDYVTVPDDLDGDGSKDYQDAEDYIQYQQLFTQTLQTLANYYRGTIMHWEIWNEENGLQWHVPAEYYARLLVKSSETVKGIDPGNKILFGGLDHVWVTGQYLEPVYDFLDNDWGGARPFDILAVHPYFVRVLGEFVLDPTVYLWTNGTPPETILDMYLDFMASRGDEDKEIWITEIGWNSALDNPVIANCPDIAAWCVTRNLQARYLADSLDILLHQVEDPQGRRDRVKAVFWYQYQDTATSLAMLAEKVPMLSRELVSDLRTVCPADWGLVDGNRAPKPSYWTYRFYGLPRDEAIYLPVVTRAPAPED